MDNFAGDVLENTVTKTIPFNTELSRWHIYFAT